MIKAIHGWVLCAAMVLCAACSTESVMPVDSSENKMTEICIKPNPRVAVPEFTYILEEGFARHGIKIAPYSESSTSCEYSLTYYATVQKDDSYSVRRKDDQTGPLNDVHLALYRGSRLIGYADRDSPKGLLDGSIMSLSQGDSTRDKMDPIIDDLLEDFAEVPLYSPIFSSFPSQKSSGH